MLTKEQEEEIDRIIQRNIDNPNKTWEFDGECSIKVDDIDGTLRQAAREIKEYLKGAK